MAVGAKRGTATASVPLPVSLGLQDKFGHDQGYNYD